MTVTSLLLDCHIGHQHLLPGWLQIVPDVLLSQALQDVEAPKAATASRSVLYGILNSPSSFARYKVCGEGGVARRLRRSVPASRRC